jgi:hypothetical protein
MRSGAGVAEHGHLVALLGAFGVGGGAACMRALFLVFGWLLQSASSVNAPTVKKNFATASWSKTTKRDRELIKETFWELRVD